MGVDLGVGVGVVGAAGAGGGKVEKDGGPVRPCDADSEGGDWREGGGERWDDYEGLGCLAEDAACE